MSKDKLIKYSLLALFFCLGLAARYYFQESEQEPEVKKENVQDGQLDGAPLSTAKPIAPHPEQPTEEAPVHPFSEHRDFEVMMNSRNNRVDFDFYFKNQETTPTYAIEHGRVNFELVGTVKTQSKLEDNVSLMIEFYHNNQASFAQREKFKAFDLAFIKESEERSEEGKFTYQFDFKETIDLDEGLYYFIIAPSGRNRVLYVDKFLVR